MQPEIRSLPAITVAGLQIRVKLGKTDFGGLWAALGSRSQEIEPKTDRQLAYGVTFGFDLTSGEFDYLAAYPVESSFQPPTSISVIRIPPQTYAVFTTALPGLMETLHQANHVWLTASAYCRGDGPEFELYDDDFDPQDPASSMYFYLPILPR